MNERCIKYWVEAKILDKVDGSIYYKTIGICAGSGSGPDQGHVAMSMARRILLRERGEGEIFIARLKIVSIEDEAEEKQTGDWIEDEH